MSSEQSGHGSGWRQDGEGGRRQGPMVAIEVEVGQASGAGSHPDAVEFVRYCYRRRRVAWPDLYDEMCAVAARGDFRGMGYEELRELGIGFALASLPRLAAMAHMVMAEERIARVAIAS